MQKYETTGTYGSGYTPCDVLVYSGLYGLKWYCVQGSINVNATYDDIEPGVDVETLNDVDTFSAGNTVESLEDLEHEVEEVYP